MCHSRRDQLNRHLPFLETKMGIISHYFFPLSSRTMRWLQGNDSGISNWQLAAVTSWYELQAFVRHFLLESVLTLTAAFIVSVDENWTTLLKAKCGNWEIDVNDP